MNPQTSGEGSSLKKMEVIGDVSDYKRLRVELCHANLDVDPKIFETLGGETIYKKVSFDNMCIGPVCSINEMDMKMLQHRNKVLAIVLKTFRTREGELEQRCGSLYDRHCINTAIVACINHQWQTLNHDLRNSVDKFKILLGLDAVEGTGEMKNSRSLVHVAFGGVTEGGPDVGESSKDTSKGGKFCFGPKEAKFIIDSGFDANQFKVEDFVKDEHIAGQVNQEVENTKALMTELLDVIKRVITAPQGGEVDKNVEKLARANAALYKTNHKQAAQITALQDRVKLLEAEVKDLKDELTCSEDRKEALSVNNAKLQHYLAECAGKVVTLMEQREELVTVGGLSKKMGSKNSAAISAAGTFSVKEVEELKFELEDVKLISANRLKELEQLTKRYAAAQSKIQEMKAKWLDIPEHTIKGHHTFLQLKSQFSVIFADHSHLKAKSLEMYNALMEKRVQSFALVEKIERDELYQQREAKKETLHVGAENSQLRKEYDMLRLEFEQNLVAHEQAAPITREMRRLLGSVQNHNTQLKLDVKRLTKKYKDVVSELTKLKKDAKDGKTGHGQRPSASVEVKKAADEKSGDAVSAKGGGGALEKVAEGDSKDGKVVEEKKQMVVQDISMEEKEAHKRSLEHHPSSSHAKHVLEKNPGGDKGVAQDKPKEKIPFPGEEVKKQEAQKRSAEGERREKPAIVYVPAPLVRSKEQPGRKEGDGTKPPLKLIHHVPLPAAAMGRQRARQNFPSQLQMSEEIKDLKAQLKKSLTEQKDIKLLLDMYKSFDKDKRDKVVIMASEKKLRLETDELKEQMKQMQINFKESLEIATDAKREERRKQVDEEMTRRIKAMQDYIHKLEQQMTAHKQEEETLLKEMEVTGTAFEDMQEQNSRLLEQLREKDEANFKLMTERIKTSQAYKHLTLEKNALEELVKSLSTEINSQGDVIVGLEEKERAMTMALKDMERIVKGQKVVLERYKTSTMEAVQEAQNAKLELNHVQTGFKFTSKENEKLAAAIAELEFAINRAKEENESMRRKLERLKKVELAGGVDAILEEEVREYKEILTCPSCKVNRKDAVLTKCFHVFCYACLRKRYDTRQRKCPQCNHAFGVNDYHRLFLVN